MKYNHPLYKEYSADAQGTLYKNNRVIKGCINKYGYRQYGIHGKTVLAHRFIFECWNSSLIDSDLVINHKNLNRSDNRMENLELVTQAENIRHYWRNYGVIENVEAKVIRPKKSGENHHNARLKRDQVIEMIFEIFSGMSNTELANKYGVHERYVSLIRHKRRWKTVWVELGLESSETS